MLSDEALLTSATRDHDRGALADFFERHQLPVYRTCLGVLRRSDLAEDATQETFITVMRQGGTVRPDGNVRGWLHRVAMNAALQVLRAERRRGRRELVAGRARLEASIDEGPADLPAEIDPAALRSHILALAARWRIPILLRFEQGLSYKEIAEVLHVSEGTVSSRLHRGLAQLREALEPTGVVVENVDLEHAIGHLPPHHVSRELETSLRALTAGLPGSRLLRWATPSVLLACALVVGAMVAVAGYFLYAAFFFTLKTPVPTGGGGATTTGGVTSALAPEQLSLRMQKTIDTFGQALRAHFLDPTLNGQAASMLAELQDPQVMPPSHRDKPALSRLASLLTDCENKQPTYAEMNWKEMEQRALELRNYPTVGKLTDRLIEWVRLENTAKEHMGDGKDYFRSNRHDEAFASFKRIDAESVYNKEAVHKMLELKTILADRTVRETNLKVRNGEFQEGLDELNRVLNLFEGKYVDVIVALNPLKKECEKNLKYQGLVQEAEILIAQRRLDDAEAKLNSLDLGAPPSLLARVEKLREAIDVARTMDLANERYYFGDGRAALRILVNATNPELVKLRTKIQKVVDATTAAQQATAKNLFDEAKKHWGEVLALEMDDKNRYRQAAVGDTGGPSEAGAAADREFEKGAEAQAANQLGDARIHYEKAMAYFPNHEKSVAAIKAFCREAQKQFNFDKTAFTKGTLSLEEIIPKFENVLAFLRPTDAVYDMYKLALDHLRTTGKF